jgi:hypothetical protein
MRKMKPNGAAPDEAHRISATYKPKKRDIVRALRDDGAGDSGDAVVKGVVYEVIGVDFLGYPILYTDKDRGAGWVDEDLFELVYRPPVPTLEDVICQFFKDAHFTEETSSGEAHRLARVIQESGCEL